MVVNTQSNTASLISMAATDIILLLIMIVGLLRLRFHGGGTFGLARLLLKQVRWLFTVVVVMSVYGMCLPSGGYLDYTRYTR
jgi:hypothetical protein